MDEQALVCVREVVIDCLLVRLGAELHHLGRRQGLVEGTLVSNVETLEQVDSPGKGIKKEEHKTRRLGREKLLPARQKRR